MQVMRWEVKRLFAMLRYIDTSDLADFLLQREPFQTRGIKAREQGDAPMKNGEGFRESQALFVIGTGDRRGIGHAPMGRDRLSGPGRANFARCVIANGDAEIQIRRVGLREFVPVFAPCASGGNSFFCQPFQGKRVDRSRRVAARAEGAETALANWFNKASAMMLRAELPVHRKSTVKVLSVMPGFPRCRRNRMWRSACRACRCSSFRSESRAARSWSGNWPNR